MLIWSLALPTETQKYNIENQVLGGRRIGGIEVSIFRFIFLFQRSKTNHWRSKNQIIDVQKSNH